MSGSEIANPDIWTSTLWLVAGLSIVRTHNRWVLGWPVVVTLMGWFAIVGGLFRMFAPEAALRGTPSPSLLLALQLLLLAIGLFLTFKALVQRRG